MSGGAAQCPHWPQRHKERAHCGRTVIRITRSRWSNNYKATIAQTAGSRRAWLGRGMAIVGWAITELRLNNYDYVPCRARPSLRRTAVATSSWAATSMHMQCRAKQTASWMSRQTQVNNCDVAATASPRQTSVAFAAQRSDRQSEPLHTNTPVSRAHPSPPASWCGSRDY